MFNIFKKKKESLKEYLEEDIDSKFKKIKENNNRYCTPTVQDEMKRKKDFGKVILLCDDIINTCDYVDAIVNPANKSLLGGGGLDGMIHYKAGPKLLEECKNFNGCETGEARITNAYNLNCKYIIHTPGPMYLNRNKETQEQQLYNAYYNSLLLAEEFNIKSISFPSISTGCYGYPIEKAIIITKKAINDYFKNNNSCIEKVYLVLFSLEDYIVCLDEYNK